MKRAHEKLGIVRNSVIEKLLDFCKILADFEQFNEIIDFSYFFSSISCKIEPLIVNIFLLGYGTLKEEKTPQIHVSHSHQLGSNPSIYSGIGGHGSQHSTGSLEQVTSPTVQNSNRPVNTGEDLYSWMAKQQEFIKDTDKGNLKGNWVSIRNINFFHLSCNKIYPQIHLQYIINNYSYI